LSAVNVGTRASKMSIDSVGRHVGR